jgi:hypothetical protein
LRRRHHDPPEVQPLGHDDLVKQRRGNHVDVGEPREVRQVILIRGEMIDGVDPPEQAGQQVPVPGVTPDELRARAEVAGPSVAVHGRGQRVEHHHVMPEREQPVGRVRSDESGAAGHEYLHLC